MKLIIDLPEEIYERIKDGYVPLGISKYLRNGTPWILDEAIDGEGKDGNVKEAEAKKCPNCGSDLYEYCFMCCYEGEVVKNNDT